MNIEQDSQLARYWGLVGLVPLATGLFGFRPAYPLLGLNTCPVRR